MQQPDAQNRAHKIAQTDTQLVRLAAAGDRPAFATLVERYQAMVFRMVFYRTRSRQDAEDITQEVFVRALKRLPTLKDAAKFRSWLLSIAVNRTRDVMRKQRLLALLGVTAAAHTDDIGDVAGSSALDPHEQLVRQEFWDQVGSFLDRLSRLEREVFLLRFWDQLQLNEIAQVLGNSQSTVKTHLYRALSKLRQSAGINRLLLENRNE